MMEKLLKPLMLLILGLCLFSISCSKDPGENRNPVAIAGEDAIVVLPENSIVLNGSDSYDPDGYITFYEWTKISGPDAYSIRNSKADCANISGLQQGVYTFQLMVTDNHNMTGTDIAQVTVAAIN
jgi:hypothetical protein